MLWLHVGMVLGAGLVILLSMLSTVYARQDAWDAAERRHRRRVLVRVS